MGKSLQEVLGSLKAPEVQAAQPDWESIPEERGAFRAAPQPGIYRFRFPDSLDGCFEITEQNRWADGKQVLGADGKPVTDERVVMILRDTYALMMVQCPKGDGKIDHTGEPFETRISNATRQRTVGKDLKVSVSPWLYLIRAVLPEARPASNAEWIQLAATQFPGREFTASISWDAFCNPKKDAFFAIRESDAADSSVRYEPIKIEGTDENIKGCGHTLYQKSWPKVDGVYADRAECPGTEEMPAPPGWKPGDLKCGAVLRAFGTLEQFKA